MKKTTLNKLIASTLALITAITLFSACTADKALSAPSNDVYGTLILSVNPEVKIEYDENGVVVGVEGVNKDGIALITDESLYIGKTCDQAIKELISGINDAGYFVEEIKGKTKNIVIKLEDGSAYPDADFLSKIEEAVKTEVGILGLDSSPVTVSENDYDEYGRISIEKVKEIALEQVGIAKEDAVFTERDYENDDDVYEIEFDSDGIEYELEVDASTGKVRESRLELNDDWNDPTVPKATPSVKDNTDTVKEKIGAETAKLVALEYTGITEPDYIWCDDSDDDDDYDIEFAANGIEYDVEVDAYTGKVTDFDKDTEEKSRVTESTPETIPVPETTPAPEPALDRISAEAAEKIALDHAGIASPDYISSEADKNEYEIEFKANGLEYEYEINAYTGEIVSHEYDSDDDWND